MKRFYLFLVMMIAASVLFAQNTELEGNLKKPKEEKEKADSVDGWKYGGVTTMTFSQTSLTNWAAGGDNSVSLTGLVNLYANYKMKKSRWDNTLDIGYGTMKQGNENAKFEKSEDRIDFASKYGQEAFKDWYYAGMLNFKTQLTATKEYPDADSLPVITTSNFMAPAYLLTAIGMDYKPNDNFTVFIAPITSKFTFVSDTSLSTKFGLEAGETSRSEIGGYLRSMYKVNIFENVTLTTKLDLFSNYSENPDRIDVNWEVLIAMKINKFLSANIHTHLIYDDDTKILWDKQGDGNMDDLSPLIQFKEVFGLGFSYKF